MSTISTAQEYIDTYYNQLKKELNARGLQISKVGLIGLLLNILGFSQQDIKLYYDTLFREAFLATADKDENITMHGSVFGYTPGLAIPATITGNISFNTAVLPISSSNNRTITLTDLTVKSDNLVYTLEADYIFKGTNCQIVDTNGNVTTVPVSVNNPSVPIQSFRQYETETYSYSIPFYVYNSYYSIVLELGNTDTKKYISSLKVEIQEDGKEDFVEYEWKLVNYSSGPLDKHVFVQFLDNKILIELGSGVHGKYIPNCNIKFTIKTTYGSLGNISKQTLKPQSGILKVFDNDTQASYSIPVSTGIDVEVDFASNGTDPLREQALRQAIIEFIRHRNNMMSENDFYDIVKKYAEDFELMFKKTHVMDNNIYLYVPYRDLYQNPIRSRSISLRHIEFNPELKCYVYNPIWTLENGKSYISPFLYVIDFTLRQYKGYILEENTSAYFDNVTVNYTPTTGDEIIALPLTLYTNYSSAIDSTRIMVQSYESITDYTFMITSEQLGFKNQCLTLSTDNIVDIYYYNAERGTGIIFDEFDIQIDVYKQGNHYFTYKLSNYRITRDVSDILSLKTFDGLITDYDVSDTLDMNQRQISLMFNDNAYVLNIPVMEYDVYEKDPNYYLDKSINLFGSIAFEENRMISDDVQIRYINTDVILSEIAKHLTKQKYEFDITFPLHLKIHIYANSSYITENQVDTLTERENLRNILAQTLFDTYTGTSISFYETQIIEIIHDLNWVKWCEIFVTDNKGNPIPNNNIESNTQKITIDNLNKFQAVTFCPYYWWWDLNNIEIEMTFE